MKKNFLALLIALLVISITPAFGAMNNADTSLTTQIDASLTNNNSDASQITDDGVVTNTQEPVITTELTNKAQIRKKPHLVSRKGMKVHYNLGKIKTKIIKKRHEMNKELREVKDKLLQCRNSEDENCKQIRTEARTKARIHLVKTTEQVLQFLERAKEKISKSGLSEEEKETALTELNEKYNTISESLENIKTVDTTENKEVIKKSISEIKSNWGQVRKNINLHLHNAYLNQFSKVFVKSEKLQEKLADRIKKLEEKGIDVSEIGQIKFEEKITEAKNFYETAKEAFENAKLNENDEETKDFWYNAKENMKLSHQSLKESREILKSIIQQMKDLKNTSIDNS